VLQVLPLLVVTQYVPRVLAGAPQVEHQPAAAGIGVKMPLNAIMVRADTIATILSIFLLLFAPYAAMIGLVSDEAKYMRFSHIRH
jgi:hypothetical protein